MSEKRKNLATRWTRETLETAYWDTLESAESFAEAYGEMFTLSALYESALGDIKETAERTDIPAGDALYLIAVQAEKALEHSLPREETDGRQAPL